jgi:predicted anti-sigma-YlaC factor YlaD
MSEAMTCKELVELVTEYLEAALPPEERARFEAHLSRCAGCQNYFDQMQQTLRLTGRLTEEALSPPARDELLRIFRDWKAHAEE